MSALLQLYVIRASDGRWLGRRGYGAPWEKDLAKARIYLRPGPARNRITLYSNEFPSEPVPELVELEVTVARAIDDTARVVEARRRRELRIEGQKRAEARRKLAYAQRQLDEAQATIDRIKGGAA